MNKLFLTCLIIFNMLFCFVGCNNVDNSTPIFNSTLYNYQNDLSPLRLAYFDSLEGDLKIEVCNIKSNDIKDIADSVISKLKIGNLKCINAAATNGIIIIEFGQWLNYFDNELKYIIAASLASTFKFVGAFEFMVIYSGGKLVEIEESEILLMPIDLSKSTSPVLIKEEYISYNEMLLNNDDFTLPFLVWENNGSDFCSAKIYELPIVKDVASSLEYLFFYDGLSKDYINSINAIKETEINSNEIVISAYETVSHYDADAILRTYRQLNDNFVLIVREYQNINSVNYDEVKYQSVSSKYGLNFKYYSPNADGFLIKDVAVELINVDECYSIVDYAIKQGIEHYISEQDCVWFYATWTVNDIALISLSETFITECESLETNEQRKLIYSIVNTVCSNLNVSSVRFLLDGYTVQNIGVINTELPINYIA